MLRLYNIYKYGIEKGMIIGVFVKNSYKGFIKQYRDKLTQTLRKYNSTLD